MTNEELTEEPYRLFLMWFLLALEVIDIFDRAFLMIE